MKKIGLKILFFAVVFGFGFSVWYSPVVFKGRSPYKIKEQIILARNIAEVDLYSMESGQNVFLPASQIKENGEPSSLGNKLTADLYAGIFKFTGILSPSGMVIVSIVLNCLALVVFALVVYRLFGFKVSALFSGLYTLLPYNWMQVYSLGSYEFSIFFLSLFFLFFVLGRESRQKNVFFWIAGCFLALAAMSREAFFLLIPISFVYLFTLDGGSVVQRFKKILPVFAPAVLILAIFYLPSFFKNTNSKLVFSQPGSAGSFGDFTSYGHLYPDPYTYHFEKESFLTNYNAKIEKVGFLESLKMKKVLANLGERGTKLWERFFLGSFLLVGHLGYFVSLEETGGPFVIFFALLGLFFYLRKKDKELYRFFIFWVLGTLFLLAYVVQVGRTHMMDFSWAMPILVALGIFYLSSLFEKRATLVSGVLAFTMLYSLFLADHVMFGKVYDGVPAVIKIENVSNKIKNNISSKDVISVGIPTQDALLLNYLADKSVLVFRGATIEKLINENRLKDVFEKYGVKYIFGYSDELAKKVVALTGAEIIETSDVQEEQVSYLRSFLLAFFR